VVDTVGAVVVVVVVVVAQTVGALVEVAFQQARDAVSVVLH